MKPRFRTWREEEVDRMRKHPEEVQLYLDISLEEALKDGCWWAFAGAMKTVAEARGLDELAARIGVMERNLRRARSTGRSPRVDAISAILSELGLRLTIQPSDKHTQRHRNSKPTKQWSPR